MTNPNDDDTLPEVTELSPKERKEQRKEVRETERTSLQSRLALKKKVRMFYDLQRLRIQSAGRGQPKAENATVQLHEIDIAVLDARSNNLLKAEKDALADIEDHLRSMPFYQQVLSDKTRWKGMGPTMAAVILAENDIVRQTTASKLWSFAGLEPVPTKRCGRCHIPVKDDGTHAYETQRRDDEEKEAKRIKCAAVVNPYDSGKAMRPVKGEQLPYNAFLKMKLVGVLGPCLLKANSPWRKFYDDYKHRKASAGWGVSDGHRHNAAIRYMVKMLLLEIWKEWRAFEGLEVRPPYAEQYLGHVHHVA